MATKKQNRCWPGYEPVPGKPEHSQGSCKPKADSKSTVKEKKFRAQRKQQLSQWKREHPGSKTQAAQHLHAPGIVPKTKAKKKAATKKKRAAAKK